MSKSKSTLLIGASSFIGRALGSYLASRGDRVIGTYHHASSKKSIDKRVSLLRCDVRDKSQVHRVIKKCKPDRVYYLAAQGSVRNSWSAPLDTFDVNCLGGLFVLEALRQLKSRARVVVISSCTVYGATYKKEGLVTEQSSERPLDPYSLSKLSLDLLTQFYTASFGVSVVTVRLVNVTGPGQKTLFSIPNFASQIGRLEKKREPPHVLHVGNLSARRDFLDIRDCVRALDLAMRKGRAGEVYHLASGQTKQLDDILHTMIRMSSLRNRKINIQRKRGLIPKDEIRTVKINSSKFRRLTGWKPKIPLRSTLSDILNYHRTHR